MDLVPAGLTLDEINQRFATDEAARAFLEGILWPNGPVCPHCKATRAYKLAPNEAKGIREGLYRCAECERNFTVTVGTIFEDSKIPLRKWLIAWYLLCSSKKGISAAQMQRMLGLGSYRSAWFLMHRIRHTLENYEFDLFLKGTIEADEMMVGGMARGKGSGYTKNKATVISLVERGGKVRSKLMQRVTKNTVKAYLRDNVIPDATLYADDSGLYKRSTEVAAVHGVVVHSKGEYARGNVHINAAEGYFSLFKRGVHGTFHHISRKHLPKYLAEFDFRYSTRSVTDGERTVTAIREAQGKRLMLKEPAKMAA